jgi:hypothetical protein
MPRKDGWKSASGQRKRSLPIVMIWPSGSSYDWRSRGGGKGRRRAAQHTITRAGARARRSLGRRVAAHLLERRRRAGGRHLLVEVEGDVRELLIDVADDLALSGGRERVAALGEQLDEPVGQVAAGEVEAEDRMREGVALVDRHGVRDAVAGVHDDAGGAAGRVERKDGLDRHVHGRHVERLEHDLSHLLAVGLRVERRLGQEDRVLLGRDAELVVEGVVPDLLHVVPVGDDAVLCADRARRRTGRRRAASAVSV